VGKGNTMSLSDNAQAALDSIVEAVVADPELYNRSNRYNGGPESPIDWAIEHAKNAVAYACTLTSSERNELIEPVLRDAICDALMESDWAACEITGEILHMDHIVNVHYRNNRYHLVEAFVGQHHDTYTCNDCDRNFLSDAPRAHRHMVVESNNVGGNDICQACYEDSYSCCGECGENYSTDDLSFHEGTEHSYCEGCYPHGLEVVNHRIKLPAKALSAKDRLAVGWEIEFYPEESEASLSSEHVEKVVHDGSLSSKGREICTQPALPHEWPARLKHLSSVMDRGEVRADCGGHLHIDARYLHELLWDKNYIDVEKLSLDNSILENLLYEFRRISDYHNYPEFDTLLNRYHDNIETLKKHSEQEKPLKQVFSLVVYFQNVLRLLLDRDRLASSYCVPQRAGDMSFDKYRAINIVGLDRGANRHTIEFRLWDGSLDSSELISRAEVCESVVRKITEITEQLISDSELAKQQAIQYIRSKESKDIISGSGFVSVYDDIEESYRLIKDLASELGLSEEWLEWAKDLIETRSGEKIDVAT